MRNTNLNTPPCSQMQKQKIVSISQELLLIAAPDPHLTIQCNHLFRDFFSHFK